MIKTVALLAFVTALLVSWSWVSTDSASAQNGPSGDHNAIGDLVLANRILASPELGVLDVWGHVSVRSTTNPNHYFISRYVSPGVVTAADIIENDLDSASISGRTDEYQERFIHGEIYKARPDVMAVVHAHTSELVVFGASSVPLQTLGSPLPNFDVRRVNQGMPGIITNPALGKALAESLGKSPAVLMLGHGVAVTDKSLPALVSRINRMRKDAQIQIMTAAIGVKNQAAKTNSQSAEIPAADVMREWDGWKAMMSKRIAAEAKPAPQKPRSTAEDLVLASKMLALREMGVLDAGGEVSVRNPEDPNHFFITRNVSPDAATASDVIEDDLDCKPTAGSHQDQRREVYIHCSIYAARPDVMTVVHAHTPEMVAFSNSSVAFRTVSSGASFLREGALPRFDVRVAGGQDVAIDSPQKGKQLAEALGTKTGLVLANHGMVTVDTSLYTVVTRANSLKLNAEILTQALLLGGRITYAETLPGATPNIRAPGETAATPKVMSGNGGGAAYDRAWEYWRQAVSRSR